MTHESTPTRLNEIHNSLNNIDTLYFKTMQIAFDGVNLHQSANPFESYVCSSQTAGIT